MVHRFPLPLRREKHEEWCIQLIGGICEIKAYLKRSRICIFFKERRTTLSSHLVSSLNAQQSEHHFQETPALKTYQGSQY